MQTMTLLTKKKKMSLCTNESYSDKNCSSIINRLLEVKESTLLLVFFFSFGKTSMLIFYQEKQKVGFTCMEESNMNQNICCA